MNKRTGPQSKVPRALPEIHAVNLPPSLHQRHRWPFTSFTVLWGKGNDQTFQGLLDTGSEWTLISGDPMSLWPPSQSRGLWRLGDQWRFSSRLSHSEPRGSPNTSCVFLPVPQCIIGIDILSSWLYPFTCSRTCGVRA